MNQEPQAPLWPDKTTRKIGAAENDPSDAERSARKNRMSFGESLQRERELRSITLDEIAASTKIGTRMLHALEAEEFDKLPGGIFNKGFVRAYARYLGLDEDQAVTDYLATEVEKERKRRSPKEPEPDDSCQGQPQLFAIQGGARADNVYNIRNTADAVQESQPDQARGFLIAAVILVFILGIGGFAWKYFNAHPATGTAASNSDSQPVASTQHTPQQPVQPVPTNTPQSDQTAAPDSGKFPSTTSADSKTSGLLVDTTTKPVSTLANSPVDPAATKPIPATTTTKSADSVAALAQGFTLDLRADEQSWVQISSEGKVLWSGIVSKDSTKSFHASKELVVKLGNAPGIQLSYNGKPLPRFSQDAKTRTLTFNAQGLTTQ